MSRLSTSFVLGYHGCERVIADRLIRGEETIKLSGKDYDWLGPGAYFWEADPQRALEWATWKTERGDYDEPFVVGAVIDLRNCLDLMSREDLDSIRQAYDSFLRFRQTSKLPMPENKSVPGQPDLDRKLRYLDCAVIRHLHQSILDDPIDDEPLEPFDTVRGMFTEGGELFSGSGFQKQTHVQIAVINPACIRGLFRPLPYPELP